MWRRRLDSIVRENGFYVIFIIQKRDFLRFLKCHVKKKPKNVESVFQVFTFLH